jgi:hypothetical protein
MIRVIRKYADFFLLEDREEILDAGVDAPGKMLQGLFEDPIINDVSYILWFSRSPPRSGILGVRQ